MVDTPDPSERFPSRRTVVKRLSGGALLAATPSLLSGSSRSLAPPAGFPPEPLISVWEHNAKVDIAPVIKEVGFNTVWTHDPPYDGKMKLEETLMWRHMQTPGVRYVIAKIERGIWGWTFDQSMRHAEWIGRLSLTHKQITGLYLNDFYQEQGVTHSFAREKDGSTLDPARKGGHTAQEFRQIIARAKSVNPRLAIWVPCYLPEEFWPPFDFDIDVILHSIHAVNPIPSATYYEQLLIESLKKFPKKPILTGLYLTGDATRRPLTEEEFKQLMNLFVRYMNEGKTVGLRIFSAQGMLKQPEYMAWAREALSKLRRR